MKISETKKQVIKRQYLDLGFTLTHVAKMHNLSEEEVKLIVSDNSLLIAELNKLDKKELKQITKQSDDILALKSGVYSDFVLQNIKNYHNLLAKMYQSLEIVEPSDKNLQKLSVTVDSITKNLIRIDEMQQKQAQIDIRKQELKIKKKELELREMMLNKQIEMNSENNETTDTVIIVDDIKGV